MSDFIKDVEYWKTTLKTVDIFNDFFNSISKYVNWVLSITLGISSLMILNFEKYANNDYHVFAKIVLIYSLINLLLVGWIKTLFLIRGLRLSNSKARVIKNKIFPHSDDNAISDFVKKMNNIDIYLDRALMVSITTGVLITLFGTLIILIF